MIKTELIHKFNVNTLIIDKEIKELFDKEINLLLTPAEVEENAVVGAIWDTAGDTRVCPLCESLSGQIFPVESGEFARLEPPIHVSCRCMLRYVTGKQRGIEERLKEYQPVDPTLLEKWSSKVYTDAEIREMVRNVSEHTVLDDKLKEFTDKYKGYKTERGVYLDVNGNLHTKGLVEGGVAATDIFVLPVGYRSTAREVHYSGNNAPTVSRIDILTDGTVRLQVSSDVNNISLDGIRFFIEVFVVAMVRIR